jgi:hypothetical protein
MAILICCPDPNQEGNNTISDQDDLQHDSALLQALSAGWHRAAEDIGHYVNKISWPPTDLYYHCSWGVSKPYRFVTVAKLRAWQNRTSLKRNRWIAAAAIAVSIMSSAAAGDFVAIEPVSIRNFV